MVLIYKVYLQKRYWRLKLKPKKLTNKERVLAYLQLKNGMACTKKQIMRDCVICKSSLDKACSKLGKEKKIDYTQVYYRCFPARIRNTYWGLK